MSNTPKIRFAGFTEDWNKKKLNQIADIIGGGTPSTNNPEYWDGNIDWYAPAEIGKQRYADGSIRKITELGLQNSSATMLPADKTILFTSRAGIGKTAILRHTGATNQGFQSLVLKDGFNPYFVYSLSDRIKRKAEAVASGSTFLEVSGKMLGNLDVMMPDQTEQKIIAEYYEELDSLIVYQQFEYDKLVSWKSACLNKMFPKNDSKVPELRFSEYSGEWTRRRLDSLMDFSNGFNGNAELYGRGIPYISVMDILNNPYITFNCIRGKVSIDERTLPRFIVNKGDVLFQRSSENIEDAGSSNVYIDIKPVVYGGFVIRGKKKDAYDVFFMKNALDSHSVRRQITSKAQGAQHINVSQETLSGVTVCMPSEEEQYQIGKLFYDIDNLIIFHQHKLEKLKMLKQALLHNMFV